MGCPKLYEDWRFVSAETAEYAYSPYGTLAKSSGSDADECSFKFSSEYLDSETNLVYCNYRYYSPELGRWTKRGEWRVGFVWGGWGEIVDIWDYPGLLGGVVVLPLAKMKKSRVEITLDVENHV